MTPTSRLFHAGVCCTSPRGTDVICPAVADCCCRPAWLPRQCSLAGCGGGAIRCRGFTRGVAQLGSALRSGRRGRGFESRHPDCVLAGSRPGELATQIAAAYPVRFPRQFHCRRWQLTVAVPPFGAGPGRQPPETPCKSARPSRIPSLIWSDTVGAPTAAVGPPPQLQLRTLNALGSAATGIATPTATLSATAALNNTFVITRCRAVGRGACCASSAPCGGPPARLAT